ncbi:MAG: YraN family protein [Planctomycetes bacterium]|nr:YraN family protein [Planctomycetota bacterium]MCB9911332.1 YraN family protein [Planctomycetota bacterium]MCB9912969.1 YraN family protein [Planctomycetota bacterium]HRV81522.1 YraN family protein [Planctomycetota bacterium]
MWVLERFPRLAFQCERWNRDQLGRASEAWVAHLAHQAAWRVLARRLLLPTGEIDLVAWDGETLVCMEVKGGLLPTRLRGTDPAHWSDHWRPGHHFGWTQFARYQAGMRRVLSQLPGPTSGKGRIDLFEVLWSRGTWSPLVVHHRDLRQPLMRSPQGPCSDSIQARFQAGVPGTGTEVESYAVRPTRPLSR